MNDKFFLPRYCQPFCVVAVGLLKVRDKTGYSVMETRSKGYWGFPLSGWGRESSGYLLCPCFRDFKVSLLERNLLHSFYARMFTQFQTFNKRKCLVRTLRTIPRVPFGTAWALKAVSGRRKQWLRTRIQWRSDVLGLDRLNNKYVSPWRIMWFSRLCDQMNTCFLFPVQNFYVLRSSYPGILIMVFFVNTEMANFVVGWQQTRHHLSKLNPHMYCS